MADPTTALASALIAAKRKPPPRGHRPLPNGWEYQSLVWPTGRPRPGAPGAQQTRRRWPPT